MVPGFLPLSSSPTSSYSMTNRVVECFELHRPRSSMKARFRDLGCTRAWCSGLTKKIAQVPCRAKPEPAAPGLRGLVSFAFSPGKAAFSRKTRFFLGPDRSQLRWPPGCALICHFLPGIPAGCTTLVVLHRLATRSREATTHHLQRTEHARAASYDFISNCTAQGRSSGCVWPRDSLFAGYSLVSAGRYLAGPSLYHHALARNQPARQ